MAQEKNDLTNIHKVEDEQELQELIDSTKKLIENADNLLKEVEEMRKGVQFLQEQYKIKKGWFRDEPGKVTTNDVIKRAFEFGWSSALLFKNQDSKKDE